MTLDADTCYAAMQARDRRFDGLFFVAVSTTGVYCRPICPARTPGRTRCTFYSRAAEAERAGYRACFRCRPELAPGHAAVDSIARLVHTAAARIDAGYLNEHSVDDLAAALGVTSRHLRRSMQTELGVTPVELAQTKRLALAKQLLQDTALPLTDVAFGAGFASIRRFNAAFLETFGRAPSALRRTHGEGEGADSFTLRLDYRPPLDWDALLRFLSARAIPGIERVEDGAYHRTVVNAERSGWISVRADPDRPALYARISLSLTPQLMELSARLRALFDLDARPDRVAAHLGADELLAPWVKRAPGLRVPGAFDSFEVALRAVLGQQITVRGATTLASRLVERFGVRAFQDPRILARAPLEEVQAIGMPNARAQTLISLSRAVGERKIDLAPGADPERTIAALVDQPGLGPWTAHYIAMRVLAWPNAFPAADVVVKKMLGVTSTRAAEARASAWQPWRAYAVIHMWNAASRGG